MVRRMDGNYLLIRIGKREIASIFYDINIHGHIKIHMKSTHKHRLANNGIEQRKIEKKKKLEICRQRTQNREIEIEKR